jgi:hypothetical protein
VKLMNRVAEVEKKDIGTGTLLVGAGLAVASLILVPAVATRIGLSSSLVGALRIALMKASYRYGSRSSGSGDVAVEVSCH